MLCVSINIATQSQNYHMERKMIIIRKILAFSAVTLFAFGCASDDNNNAGELALLALALQSGPTECSVTSARGTVTMPLVNLDSAGTVEAKSILDSASGKYWTAIRVKGAQDGTTLQFGYDPKYAPGGPTTFIITYVTDTCPVTDLNNTSDPSGDTASDNAISTAGFANATNYLYVDSSRTVRFDADAAGKDFIITTGADSDPTGQTITRVN